VQKDDRPVGGLVIRCDAAITRFQMDISGCRAAHVKLLHIVPPWHISHPTFALLIGPDDLIVFELVLSLQL
jgi:hypothetical protein